MSLQVEGKRRRYQRPLSIAAELQRSRTEIEGLRPPKFRFGLDRRLACGVRWANVVEGEGDEAAVSGNARVGYAVAATGEILWRKWAPLGEQDYAVRADPVEPRFRKFRGGDCSFQHEP